MQPVFILLIIALYFLSLTYISYVTGKKASTKTFFIGDRNSPWYAVAYGMVGASLSGLTFISVPGWVGSSQFAYMQMALGYLLGYFVIAVILLPLYYRLNLTSIYSYLEQRFGFWSYKSGAFYFIVSRVIGASLRLYLMANVLQITVFDQWHIPFSVTVLITIFLIWIYTFRGGIKTIVWTDTLQTTFMLISVGVAIYLISEELKLDLRGLYDAVKNSEYSKVFFLEDWSDKKHFIKQFFSGAFIAIVMTGLDQDMMQKNLSCRNLKDAQKNMFSFSAVLLIVNFVFLTLGALLYLFAKQKGIELPAKSDDLFPLIAMGGYLDTALGVFFILGLVAAAYSSADSALTSLTTSFCIDFLNIESKEESIKNNLRRKAHIGMSLLLFACIMIFSMILDENAIYTLFRVAGYTYGPLLGMFAFGLFTKYEIHDKLVFIPVIISPLVCLLLNIYSIKWLNGYEFGFELLILNGILTFVGLFLIRNTKIKKQGR